MKVGLAIISNKVCADITLSILCDGQSLMTVSADAQCQSWDFEVADTPGDHQIELAMSGKTRRHTQVSSDGEIIEDVFFSINRLEFEGIDVRGIFCQGRLCYTHDFNGSQPELQDEFYGIIGCNGKVCLEFSQPLFLWLGDYLD